VPREADVRAFYEECRAALAEAKWPWVMKQLGMELPDELAILRRHGIDR